MDRNKAIQFWLAAGLVMIFFQIVIGGVTRLTGSGLSITKWEIVTGTLPPRSESSWNDAFEAYKQTPQYQKINEGMSMGDFKFIYFWEYFHRLWARIMGFVFIIPFALFAWRSYFTRTLFVRLGILFILAALVASFGWIMVASGLIERPWVNTYKLTLHLSLAIVTFLYLWFIYLSHVGVSSVKMGFRQRRSVLILFGLLALQIALGGIVSGAKAAMAYPTWPTMNGSWIPDVLLTGDNWVWSNFVQYDQNIFFPALVQFLHRNLAYILTVALSAWMVWTGKRYDRNWWLSTILMSAFLVLQLVLGVLTLLHSKGTIPVLYGELHQAIGILLISTLFYQVYRGWKPAIG